jgi:hypothetical protein
MGDADEASAVPRPAVPRCGSVPPPGGGLGADGEELTRVYPVPQRSGWVPGRCACLSHRTARPAWLRCWSAAGCATMCRGPRSKRHVLPTRPCAATVDTDRPHHIMVCTRTTPLQLLIMMDTVGHAEFAAVNQGDLRRLRSDWGAELVVRRTWRTRPRGDACPQMLFLSISLRLSLSTCGNASRRCPLRVCGVTRPWQPCAC